MKFNAVKTLIAFAISVILGLICYEIAEQEEYRNFVSLAITAITDFICFTIAFGCEYSCGNRNVNIRVVASTMTTLIVLYNFVFSFFSYSIIIYAAIAMLIMLIDILLVYSLAKGSKNNAD